MNRISALVALSGMALAACNVRATVASPATPTQTAIPATPIQQTPIPPTVAAALTPTSIPRAGEFPDPKVYFWTPVATGYESPVDIQFPSDGSGRMFIVEQRGRIRVVDGSGLLIGTFLDISDRVESSGNEQGLLGLAFHPRYAENGQFFVNYTDKRNHNIIARFQVSGDADLADAASESILLSIDDPFANHNGGVLAFGPDEFLYAGLGDGGGANDPLGNGQNPNVLLGKILRLDVDHGSPYGVPEDNPFVQGGGRPEIWAIGLRNPWRMSFDTMTGDLFIGDVGQGTWEEVDVLKAGSPGGANFGWKYREGAHAFARNPPAGTPLMDPAAEYSHSEGGCSITGGYMYRGSMPQWNGIYLFGDFCTGKLWGLRAASDPGSREWEMRLLYETGANITTFGQDKSGEVYFADRKGSIYRLQLLP